MDWQTLYEKHKDAVWKGVRRWCVSNHKTLQDCEDACGEAWAETFKNFERFDGKNFAGWAYIIAINYLVRKSCREKLYDDFEHAEYSEQVTFATAARAPYAKKVVFRPLEEPPVAEKNRVLYEFLVSLQGTEFATKRLRYLVSNLFKQKGYSPRFQWRDFRFLEVQY